MLIKKTLFIFIITLIAFNSCKKEDLSDIYQEPGYSIGTINTYLSIPLKVTYYYDFDVNGVNYEGKKIAKGIGQLDEKLIDKSFLVVYKSSDISNNDLNFNYSIKDEQEFSDLVDSFKNNPPKQD